MNVEISLYWLLWHIVCGQKQEETESKRKPHESSANKPASPPTQNDLSISESERRNPGMAELRKNKSYHLEEKHLVVEAVVIAGFPEGIVLLDFASRWEAEEAAASGVLQALSEGLVAADLDVADGAAGGLHGLLEVSTSELGHGVFHLLFLFAHRDVLAGSLALLLAVDVGGDSLLDGELDRTLCHEAEIGTGEAVGLAGNEGNVDVARDRSLAELGLEDTLTGLLVRQGDVDQRVKTTRTDQSGIELLGTVGSTNDEDVLLRSHTIHLCEGVSEYSGHGKNVTTITYQ